MKSTNRGFTLVEIMVVITVLSLLASIIIFSGSTARESAKDTIGQQDVQQLLLALRLYLETNNELPPDTDWATAVSGVNGLYPDYLSQPILVDAWGREFVYQNNYGGTNNLGSMVCSNGPDGNPDTEDSDLANYEAGGDDICQFIFDED